jgi:iron complex outermembrane receptor protein
MNFRRTKVAVALGASGFALIAAAPALAQDIRVNVTGSNIKKVESESASPIQTITRQDIDESGLNTIADVLHQITANSNGTIAAPWSGVGFAAGATAISLRGLGSNNTLVLLNGRRLAVYGLADDGKNSFVDLNQIPFDAVERIEILKNGASAVYGSDAVAGVVNIITNQQFTGGAINVSGGTTYNGDGNQYRGSVTLGTGDLTKDKYNVFVTIDGQHQSAINTPGHKSYIGSLDLTNYNGVDLRPGTLGNGNNDNSLSSSSQVGNIRILYPSGVVGLYQSLPGCNPANVVGPQQLCAWDYKNWLQIEPKAEKLNVFARGSYNFTDTTQGYAELSYFDSKLWATAYPATTNGAWYSLATQSVISAANTVMPASNPANPTGYDVRLRYNMADVGGQNTNTDTQSQRYLVGLKGTNWDWDWDASVLYMQTNTDITQTGLVNYPNLLAALNGQGGFGYYQPGIAAVNNNPGIYGFIAPALSYTPKSDVTQVDVKGSHDLMKLEGGAMALALGAGYRHESVTDPGIPGTFEGDILGYGFAYAQASRNVWDAYAELYLPVLKNLEFTAAVRWDNYTDFGSTWNPLVQGKWTILPSLVLRGTFATGFRAPGPAEFGSKSSNVGFTSYVDPTRCPVTGAPADCGGGQTGQATVGNPNIQPETSDTWTVGAIWEPLPGLSGTLDYWYIKTKNQIQQPDPQAVLNNPSSFPGTSVIRDTNNLPGIPNSGTVLLINGAYQNISNVTTDGIDLDVLGKYNTTDYGKYTAELQWTHIFEFKRTLGGVTLDYVDSHGPTNLSSSAGMPQDRINVIFGWSMGGWAATATVVYISPIPQTESKGLTDADGNNPCLQSNLVNPDTCRAPSWTTLNLQGQYTGFKNWTIYGSVINVFNRIAPFDPQAGYNLYNYNFNYAQSGATGTQFNIGAKYTF